MNHMTKMTKTRFRRSTESSPKQKTESMASVGAENKHDTHERGERDGATVPYGDVETVTPPRGCRTMTAGRNCSRQARTPKKWVVKLPCPPTQPYREESLGKQWAQGRCWLL